jgi:hypothetical protein
MNGYNEDKVAIFEIKLVTKIYGPICDVGR